MPKSKQIFTKRKRALLLNAFTPSLAIFLSRQTFD
jgi:hypothetical protein